MPEQEMIEDEELSPREIVAKKLTEVGVASELSEFLADCVESEVELGVAVLDVLRRTIADDELLPASDLQHVVQGVVGLFREWQKRITSKVAKGEQLRTSPVFEYKKLQALNNLRARYSLKLKHFALKKGDEIHIADKQNGKVRIRNSAGEEQSVSDLSIFLPCPYASVAEALIGLRLQLLTLWSGIVCQLKSLLVQSIQVIIHPTNGTDGELAREDAAVLEAAIDNNNVSSINWSHVSDTIRQLTSQKSSLTESARLQLSAVENMITTVKIVEEDSRNYRNELNDLYQSSMVQFVDRLASAPAGRKKKFIRFKEVRTTLERNSTTEEITYFESTSTGGGSQTDKISADQVTSTSKEVRQSLVIRAVIDPRNGQEISLAEAIDAGIVDSATGTYRNPDTGETLMSLAEAMGRGNVLVEQQHESVSEETTQSMGIIQIETLIDNRPYTIDKVFDAERGERVPLDEAQKRKLINVDEGVFIQSTTGDKVPLFDAIQEGWVMATYTTDEPAQYQKVTYAVTYVVDQKEKRKVPFHEAVDKGLIDKDTGNYYHNVNDETVHVKEALRRGFLKAKVVENENDHFAVNLENQQVSENVEKVRKNVVKMAATMKAFTKASGKK